MLSNPAAAVIKIIFEHNIILRKTKLIYRMV